eukprot:g11948.t1
MRALRNLWTRTTDLLTGSAARATAVQRIYVSSADPAEAEEEVVAEPDVKLEVEDLPDDAPHVVTFSEDARNGYSGHAQDRERWLEATKIQAMTRGPDATRKEPENDVRKLRLPDSSPERSHTGVSGLAGLRDPGEVFTEELKRWNRHMTAQERRLPGWVVGLELRVTQGDKIQDGEIGQVHQRESESTLWNCFCFFSPTHLLMESERSKAASGAPPAKRRKKSRVFEKFEAAQEEPSSVLAVKQEQAEFSRSSSSASSADEES